MKLLTALCLGNKRILLQKMGLMDALIAKHGADSAREIFKTTCPIVKATIGQHFRHSLDHIEPVVLAGLDDITREIHYDLRTRGGTDEHDWEAAKHRLKRVGVLFNDLVSKHVEEKHALIRPVQACFMLSGDSDEESPLKSTLSRELGFAMHHAIHHMAMVRIMATCQHVGGLSDEELPPDFGRAPSTVNFDHSLEQ